MSFGYNSPHILGALTLHPRTSRPAFWELSLGQLRVQVMAVVAEGTWVLGETLPPQVCRGPCPQLPKVCCLQNVPGVGHQTPGRGGIAVVFECRGPLTFARPKVDVGTN